MKVSVFSRPGCGLCAEALRELRGHLADRPDGGAGIELEEIDIESEDELFKRYLERIPVIRVGSEEISELFFEPEAFDLALGRLSRGRGRDEYADKPMAPPSKSQADSPLLVSEGDRLALGVAARLSRYLQVLIQARKMGRETISSQELSEYTHINPTQIRRDLSGFGKFGKRGVGYRIDYLIEEIRKIMRTAGQHNIALFGAGNLGQAIAVSDVFADHGFRIVSLFDVDPAMIGKRVGPLTVRDFAELKGAVEEEAIVVGVLAVPSAAAQEVADGLVQAGVTVIFNYTEQLLQVPPEVTVHTSSPAVDLLYALYFYLS